MPKSYYELIKKIKFGIQVIYPFFISNNFIDF